MECHTRNTASLRKYCYKVHSLLLPLLHSPCWWPSADVSCGRGYSTTSSYFPFFCYYWSLHLSCFAIRTKLFVIAYDIKDSTLNNNKIFCRVYHGLCSPLLNSHLIPAAFLRWWKSVTLPTWPLKSGLWGWDLCRISTTW